MTWTGDGGGTVTSSDGISCASGSACLLGGFVCETVTLSASASQGSTFKGWRGDCLQFGTAPCELTFGAEVSATYTVSAEFLLSPSDVTFHDEVFSDGDWTVVDYANGSGGSGTGVQTATGGNPDSFRTVTTQVDAPGTGATSSVFSFHWKSGAVYDPADPALGSIASIDYGQDAKLFNGGGAGQATSLALRQAGRVFYSSTALETTPERAWTRKGRVGLVATDFVFIAPDCSSTPERPDFSTQGAPIEFGFLRANSTAVGGAGYTIVGGIDNWSVTIHRNP